MIQIPFSEFPHFSQDVSLDGLAYRFVFLWNTRAGHWAMSVYDLQENPLVIGIPVALDMEILRQYPSRGLPPGEIRAVDPSGKLQIIGREDLAAGRVLLIYTPEAEV